VTKKIGIGASLMSWRFVLQDYRLEAKEMGMDWWVNNPSLCSRAKNQQALPEAIGRLEDRLARIETSLASGMRSAHA